MEINKPSAVAEVTAAFEAYERALMANDVDALVGDFFWEDPRVLRYSMGTNSYGPDEIRAARTRIPSADRTLERTIITTFGDDFATANTVHPHRDRQARTSGADLGALPGCRLARGGGACELVRARLIG